VSFGPAGLWQCHDCGSQFLSPQPTDERLTAIYSDDYYEPWKVETPERLRRMKELTFAPLIDRVRRRRPSTVLDLGCATGELLGMLDGDGVRLFGVDLNPRAIEQTQARLPKATLHAGTLRDEPFPGETFDVVTMVDFIEHVRDPRAELTMVANRLSPDGIVIMSTPRVDSVVRRLSGRAWPQYREEHLTYFTRAGMATALRAAGLSISEVVTTRKAVTPAYIYGQATALPIPVVTPIIEAAYKHLPVQRLGPYRLWFGEMTVVAERASAPDRERSRGAPV
jgi:2-polyprenyl-3-methyl-5-hydroxy-6-metoxy-1,4-benzoquinol methylase